LAEKYAFASPYQYVLGNPVRFVDVLGMEPGDSGTPIPKSSVATVGGDNKPPALLTRFGNWLSSFFHFPGSDNSTAQNKFNQGANKSLVNLKPVGENIETIIETGSTFIPGASSFYEVKEGDFAMAAIYGIIDFSGGAVLKGVGSVVKLVSKEVLENSLSAAGKEIFETLSKNQSVRESFESSSFKMMEATEDMMVFRVSGGGSLADKGAFFSLHGVSSATEADKMLNISKWGNTVEQITPVLIPNGTQFGFGRIEGGTGLQLFIPLDQQTKQGVVRMFNKTINIPKQ
jgi:hypothetical protein